MDIMEAMKARHSVRSFTDEPLGDAERAAIEEEVARCNEEGGLSIRLVTDEPQAFDSTLAHYGKFSNVRNYLVMAGPASLPDLAERVGYYGERIVLLATQLGLGTCWVALTFKKRHVKKMVGAGDKLVVVVAIGHPAKEGSEHKVKQASEVCSVPAGADVPAWFITGVDAALLAPTAVNQQKFLFELTGSADADGRPLVASRATGGTYSDVDLGIVRLHFEIGAGAENFAWAS